MKQALQLRLGQQLALTPQLQQAIKLLQMSTVDLQQVIEETLESNALLLSVKASKPIRKDSIFPRSLHQRTMPEDLAVDTVWEDALPSSAPPSASAVAEADFAEQDSEEESLQRSSCSGN